MARLNVIYAKYKDSFDFAWIYTQEAHPETLASAGRPPRSRVPTLAARRRRAADAAKALGIKVPAYLDDMDNTAARTFAAWPTRFFVLAPEGRIAVRGHPGPWGFHTAALDASLKALLPAARAARASSAN